HKGRVSWSADSLEDSCPGRALHIAGLEDPPTGRTWHKPACKLDADLLSTKNPAALTEHSDSKLLHAASVVSGFPGSLIYMLYPLNDPSALLDLPSRARMMPSHSHGW